MIINRLFVSTDRAILNPNSALNPFTYILRLEQRHLFLLLHLHFWLSSQLMGGKKKSAKPPPKRRAPRLALAYTCPLCNVEKAATAKIDTAAGVHIFARRARLKSVPRCHERSS